MEPTKTEFLISQLNFSTIHRLNNSDPEFSDMTYPLAIKNIVLLFTKQAEKGILSFEDVADFKEQLSILPLLDNAKSYGDVQSIVSGFDAWYKSQLDAREYNDIQLERAGGKTI